MHVQFGPYHVGDVQFVAAFDVDAKKVGQDLAHAITASENNTIQFCDVPPTGVLVQRGHTLDGLGKYYREMVTESDEEPVDIVFLLLAPEHAGADHLKALSRIARILRDPDMVAKLRGTPDAAALYSFLTVQPTSNAA